MTQQRTAGRQHIFIFSALFWYDSTFSAFSAASKTRENYIRRRGVLKQSSRSSHPTVSCPAPLDERPFGSNAALHSVLLCICGTFFSFSVTSYSPTPPKNTHSTEGKSFERTEEVLQALLVEKTLVVPRQRRFATTAATTYSTSTRRPGWASCVSRTAFLPMKR